MAVIKNSFINNLYILRCIFKKKLKEIFKSFLILWTFEILQKNQYEWIYFLSFWKIYYAKNVNIQIELMIELMLLLLWYSFRCRRIFDALYLWSCFFWQNFRPSFRYFWLIFKKVFLFWILLEFHLKLIFIQMKRYTLIEFV